MSGWGLGSLLQKAEQALESVDSSVGSAASSIKSTGASSSSGAAGAPSTALGAPASTAPSSSSSSSRQPNPSSAAASAASGRTGTEILSSESSSKSARSGPGSAFGGLGAWFGAAQEYDDDHVDNQDAVDGFDPSQAEGSSPGHSRATGDTQLADFLDGPVREAKDRARAERLKAKQLSAKEEPPKPAPAVVATTPVAAPPARSTSSPLISGFDDFATDAANDRFETSEDRSRAPPRAAPARTLVDADDSFSDSIYHTAHATPANSSVVSDWLTDTTFSSRTGNDTDAGPIRAELAATDLEEPLPALVLAESHTPPSMVAVDQVPVSSDNGAPAVHSESSAEQALLAEIDDLRDRQDEINIENQMLKEQLVNLGEELSGLSQRLSKSESRERSLADERTALRAELHAVQQQSEKSASDNSILSQKLKVTEVKLGKLESSLSESADLIEKLRSEALRATAARDNLQEAHIHSKDAVNAKVTELEAALSTEREAHAAARQAAQDREQHLETQLADASASVVAAQRQADIALREAADATRTLGDLQDSVSRVTQELAAYKARAQRVLAEKDDEISRLTGSADSARLSQSMPLPQDSAFAQASSAELESLRAELLSVQQQANIQAEMAAKARRELQEFQRLAADDAQASTAAQLAVEEASDQLRAQAQQLRAELKVATSSRDTALLARDTSLTQLKESEQRVQKLKQQLLDEHRSDQQGGEAEQLRLRVEELTSTLYDRQQQLDSTVATAHANSLEAESLRDQLIQYRESHSRVGGGGGFGDVETGLRQRGGQDNDYSDDETDERTIMFKSKPLTSLLGKSDSALRQREGVVKAARALDSISGAFGEFFLSSRPLIRLGAMLYIIVLHLWVFYMLTTFNPEMHSGVNDAAALSGKRPKLSTRSLER